MELFPEQEEISLFRKENPFFELYEGQHKTIYKPSIQHKPSISKINLNNPDNEKRIKHIEMIKKKMRLKSDK